MIDLIFLILIILMLIRGYLRGFIEEVFSWAASVLAIWVAVLLYPAGAAFIRSKVMQDVRYVPEILAFVAIFFVVTIFLKLVEKILKDVVMGANLGWADKILGLLFGLVEGLTLTALILFILSIQPLVDPEKIEKILENSIFAEILLPLIRIPLEKGKDIVNTVFYTGPGIWFPV